MKRHSLALAIALVAAGSHAASAHASTVGSRAGIPTRTATSTIHRYFGLLVGRRGTNLTLRLRSGALLLVDASAAFAVDHVSSPLFAGKATVVQGTIGANGVFHATSVKRAAPLPSTWDIDR
jgi:hypothetical protein